MTTRNSIYARVCSGTPLELEAVPVYIAVETHPDIRCLTVARTYVTSLSAQ